MLCVPSGFSLLENVYQNHEATPAVMGIIRGIVHLVTLSLLLSLSLSPPLAIPFTISLSSLSLPLPHPLTFSRPFSPPFLSALSLQLTHFYLSIIYDLAWDRFYSCIVHYVTKSENKHLSNRDLSTAANWLASINLCIHCALIMLIATAHPLYPSWFMLAHDRTHT